MAPFMRPGLERWDRIAFLSLILGGAVFLVGVFVLELMETHRTAGAFQNLRRRLEELRSGRLAAHLKLRRHDHFPELDKAFNDAVATLRTRTEGKLLPGPALFPGAGTHQRARPRQYPPGPGPSRKPFSSPWKRCAAGSQSSWSPEPPRQ